MALSSMKTGVLRSKTEKVDRTAVDGKKTKTTGTLTIGIKDEDSGASFYSKTKEKNGEQKAKTFTKIETEEGPEYSMKKNYKPLLSGKYKEVDREITARRG
jgi:hypothetical protein